MEINYTDNKSEHYFSAKIKQSTLSLSHDFLKYNMRKKCCRKYMGNDTSYRVFIPCKTVSYINRNFFLCS